MKIIVEWGAKLLILISFIYLVAANAVRFAYWCRCRKIKQCRSTKCRYRRYCDKWVTTFTEEEINSLRRVLEENNEKNE